MREVRTAAVVSRTNALVCFMTRANITRSSTPITEACYSQSSMPAPLGPVGLSRNENGLSGDAMGQGSQLTLPAPVPSRG